MNRLLTGLARLRGPISPWILMDSYEKFQPGFRDEEKVDDSGDELEKESTLLAETHKL